MAGPLLLDSALDEVKLGLLPPLASDSVMVLSVFDSAGYTKVSGLTGDAVPLLHPHNEEAGRPGSTLFLAANGQYSPVTRALSQGAHRLRLVNTAVKQAVLLTASVTGTDTDAGEGCSFFLTASDGTPQRHPRKLALTPLDPLLLVPGNRRDVVYQCQCKSCVVTWDSDGRQTGSKKEMRWVGSTTDVDSSGTFLTTLVYDTDADADAQSPSLSAWLGDAPDWSAALSDRLFPAEGLPPPASTDRHFRFVFNQGGSVQRGGETVTSYGVNGEAMPMNASHARQVQLGAVEEWVVSNDHPTATHPFHLHTNHFEIVSSSAPHLSDVDFHVGDWRDSISIGPQQNVTIRWRANDYTGLLMAHCHVSTHSDTGMGMPVRIVETHT
jgi:FtsP/CotA-like multicopper oxidase with cupredoxin domain